VRIQETGGVRDRGEIIKGTDMNSGETKHSRKNEYDSTSCKRQVETEDALPVGLTHITREAQETERREGVSRDTQSLEETFAILRDGAWTETKLRLITQRGKEIPKYKFTSLAYLLNEGFLEQCFKDLSKNKACGIDGVTVKEYEANLGGNLKDLVNRMKTLRYYPQPVKRVNIPKANGKTRPLGISTIEDKIVQLGIKRVLEAIFEGDFCDSSYGFRPNRSCHDALDALDKTIMMKPVNVIVDMDIEQFYDSIDRKWLMECLKQRINDTGLLRLIARFLRAGIIEEGKHYEVDKGTVQGDIMSPVLSNIYLHFVLNLWFEKVAQKQLKGFSKLVTYADDFVVCYESRESAEQFIEMLKERFAKFGLKISESKSRVIDFGRKALDKATREGGKVATFDFLGFTHFCDKTRKGKFKLGRKTSERKFRQKMVAINDWLKKIRNCIKQTEWWEVFRMKLAGHYRYYGISGNMRALRKFHYLTSELAYKWLNRRSQKRSLSHSQFTRYLKSTLPVPKIYHLTYALSSF